MKSVALTDIGKRRTINQDTVFLSNTAIGPVPNLFVVADGMGGENAGDYASKSMISYLVASLKNTMKPPVVALREAIEYANTNLYAESIKNTDLSGMGTTAVVATIIGRILYVFNVGDSRAYIIDENGILQITKDHSYVEMLVSTGAITRESKEYRENKSKITRAVGADEDILIDCFEVELMGNEVVLMCSDGLTNMLDDDKIQKIVSSGASISDCAKRLVDDANFFGGVDNISVLLIDLK